MTATGDIDRDFFVSYTGADARWAEWLVAELEDAGFSCVSQAFDFVPGNDFMLEMQAAVGRSRRTLGILSPKALQAPYLQKEWAQRIAEDPNGAQRGLVLVRVEPCEPGDLLRALVHIDLVGLDEAAASDRLRRELAAVVHGRRPLPTSPEFPGGRPGPAVADARRPPFPAGLPRVWNLPFRRNGGFVGRERLLAELAGKLGEGPDVSITALWGDGGMGKTAVAIEFAFRYRSEFDVVWWVRADRPATLVGDYRALAVALDLPEAGETDQRRLVPAVRHWLERNRRWLLVLDDAGEPEGTTMLEPPLHRLVDLTPRVCPGQLLVTTRDATWARYAGLKAVPLFEPTEALDLLGQRSGAGDGQATAAIADRLGGLPLAVEQARAYIDETGVSPAEYLDRLQQSLGQALARGHPRDRDRDDTVTTTWKVSAERVRSVPGANALLEVCAFLAPERIPRELRLRPVLADALGLAAGDPFAVDTAVAELRRFGLIAAAEGVLTMHGLLQEAVRDDLAPAGATSRVAAVIRLLNEEFPEQGLDDHSTWPHCERLLPHVLAATEHAVDLGTELRGVAYVLSRAAAYLQGRGHYHEALKLLERSLKLTERAFGPDDRRTGYRLNDLGGLLVEMGDPAAARTVLERALPIFEAAHSERIGTVLENLGQALLDAGDRDGARRLFERALESKQRAFGPEHRSVAITLNSLGLVLHEGGELSGARRHFERSLAIKERAWGPEHREVGVTLHNLGDLFLDLGDPAGARERIERALAIEEATLGPEHPNVATTHDTLAEVLRRLGDEDGARGHRERASAIRQARG